MSNRYRPKQLVREIAKTEIRSRTQRAFLAEEYDGIGQYVKVTLSRNAVTSGLRARLCSGDFGTGQTIPEGTEVTIFTYHGKIEILSLGAK